jgi:hypothetical protein
MYKDRGLYISLSFQNQMQNNKEALSTLNSIRIIARATAKDLNHSSKAS